MITATRAATQSNIILNGEQQVDGISLVPGDRVLVRSQTLSEENGIYLVQEDAWVRAPDFDDPAEIKTGSIVPVIEGLSSQETFWDLEAADPVVIGTTPLTFSAFRDLSDFATHLTPVRVATLTDLALTGEQSVDGIAVVAGDRVLVKDQTLPSENGIYRVDTGPWLRAEDFNSRREIRQGVEISVLEGSSQAESLWLVASPSPVSLGTTPISFSAFRDLSDFATRLAPVRVATATDIALTGEQTVDGIALFTGDRVLVKDQNVPSDNGIYRVHPGPWSRAEDFNSRREIRQGVEVSVLEGAAQAESLWLAAVQSPVTLGTTPISFSTFRNLSDFTTHLAPVRVATLTDIALNGEQTVDGIAVVTGDRVLVKDQTLPSENGIYRVNADSWTRAEDFNSSREIRQGVEVSVLEGTAQAESLWLVTAPPPVSVGTTPILFSAFRNLSMFLTANGVETLSNKTFEGGFQFYTAGDRIAFSSRSTPLGASDAFVHIVNDNEAGAGLVVTSYWQGTAETPYTNNDVTLFETYNKTLSNSGNRSWAASCSNAYHSIPLGVTDSGERLGVIGWATSVAKPGYLHEGTMNAQYGVQGTAGYQGPGSGPAAVINDASGIRGLIYADSAGSTIKTARAGSFASDGGPSTIERNIGVYSRAKNGTIGNYAFYGDGGKMFNSGQIAAVSEYTQSGSNFAARQGGNSFEFGYPDGSGYGCNVGATFAFGYPFIAFCGEADPTGNTFRTRGRKGAVISSDLTGSTIFSRLTNANSAGQNLVESGRFDDAGRLRLSENIVLKRHTPATANAPGITGETCWDDNYLYVCIATNQWKRSPLASW